MRGVFTQENGQIFGGSSFNIGGGDSPLDGAIDRSAADMTTAQEKTANVFSTKTATNYNKQEDS